MAGPRKVSKEQYDEFRSKMEEKYGYDEMSDEEKKDFDEKIDQVAVVDNKTDQTDADDGDEREERERGDGHPHSLEDDDDENIR
ncbi:hypothetical protein NIF40_03060 [[Clostridium] leptum]|uniref:Uncharacterized protein n=1 Tax=Solibaculum mannosilyticum TaxID=2780922 RepID=A0A7I8D599_9FIRM|nr:hypothetical protein [Solibaculum mannosilyticum]MCO7136509.1 hypothetical protein [[Clostridium] leptum]BCI60363.1 hypothetical protein C12CBH8_10020 [Solibaculum mannosilyticum]CZT54976.1 hypothetical protein BN3661_00047 [Eubacteriaceae bacterium CHKCI005]